MNISKLTFLAWLLATAFYAARALLVVAPGAAALWTGHLDGAMNGLHVAAVMLWALACILHVLALLRSRERGLPAAAWHLAMAVLCCVFFGQTLADILGGTIGTVQDLDLLRRLGLPVDSRFSDMLKGFNGVVDPAHVLMLLSTFVCIAMAATQQEMPRHSPSGIPTPSDGIVVFFAFNLIAYLAFGALGVRVDAIFLFGIAGGYTLAALAALRKPAVEQTAPDPQMLARMWAVRFDRTRGFAVLQESIAGVDTPPQSYHRSRRRRLSRDVIPTYPE